MNILDKVFEKETSRSLIFSIVCNKERLEYIRRSYVTYT